MTKFKLFNRTSTTLALASAALFSGAVAHAGDEASLAGVTTVADTVLEFMTGPIATAAGAIAIAIVGYRWFSGRMEMGKAVATVAGIVLVIGSVQIVEFIRTGSGLADAQEISTGSLETPTPTLFALNDEVLSRRLIA